MEYFLTCRHNGSALPNMNDQNLKWTTELVGVVKVQRYICLRDQVDFCEDSIQILKPPKPKYNKKEVLTASKWRNATQKQKNGAALNSLVKKGLNPPTIIEGAEAGSDLLATVGIVPECDKKALPAEKIVYENLDQCQSDVEDGDFDLDSAFLKLAT